MIDYIEANIYHKLFMLFFVSIELSKGAENMKPKLLSLIAARSSDRWVPTIVFRFKRTNRKEKKK